jgi:hypothetical protein
MLVSLFEYWRSYEFAEEPTEPLIQCARRGTFRTFVAMAVAEGGLPNYHDFFDMHGPAAANTRLLDFNALEPALAEVCRDFGLDVTQSKLGLVNVGPSRHPAPVVTDRRHPRRTPGAWSGIGQKAPGTNWPRAKKRAVPLRHRPSFCRAADAAERIR